METFFLNYLNIYLDVATELPLRHESGLGQNAIDIPL